MTEGNLQQPGTPVTKHLVTFRRCPACGAGVGRVRLWLWGWIFSQWACRSCGARLGFNTRRRMVVALLAGPFTAVALALVVDRQWLLALASFALGMLVWRFDSLRLVAPRESVVPDARR